MATINGAAYQTTFPMPDGTKYSRESVLDGENKDNLDYTVIAHKKINISEEECSNNITDKNTSVNCWKDLPWSCFLCAHRAIAFKNLRIHLAKVHYINDVDNIRLLCTDCGQYMDSYAQFINHVRRHHHPCLQNFCDACDMHFSNEDLSDHRKLHLHSSFLIPDLYYCPNCFDVFSSDDDLATHSRLCNVIGTDGGGDVEDDPQNGNLPLWPHQTQQAFNCKYCPKVFSNEHLRDEHVYLHTRSFFCELCSQAFRREANYNHHLLTRGSESEYKCPDCPGIYKYKCQLQKHILEHELTCKYCLEMLITKQFKSSYSLRQHIRRMHEGVLI